MKKIKKLITLLVLGITTTLTLMSCQKEDCNSEFRTLVSVENRNVNGGYWFAVYNMTDTITNSSKNTSFYTKWRCSGLPGDTISIYHSKSLYSNIEMYVVGQYLTGEDTLLHINTNNYGYYNIANKGYFYIKVKVIK